MYVLLLREIKSCVALTQNCKTLRNYTKVRSNKHLKVTEVTVTVTELVTEVSLVIHEFHGINKTKTLFNLIGMQTLC